MSNEPTSADYDAIFSANVCLRMSDQGTADELALSMIRTVQRLAFTVPLSRERARFLLDEDIDQLELFGADSEDEHYWSEAVEQLKNRAEEIALEIGYNVTWDDGYNITDLVPLTPFQRKIVCAAPEHTDILADGLDDYTDEALGLELVSHDGIRIEQPEPLPGFVARVAYEIRSPLAPLVDALKEYDKDCTEWSERNEDDRVPSVKEYENHDDALSQHAEALAEAVRTLLTEEEEI